MCSEKLVQAIESERQTHRKINKKVEAKLVELNISVDDTGETGNVSMPNENTLKSKVIIYL